MQLKPRHLVLLAIILLIFAYDIYRSHQRKQQEAHDLQQTNSVAATAWTAYDHAASLRDASEDQFQTAFTSLRNATEGPTADQNAQALTDVRTCKTWLVFYRNPQWRDNAKKHVDGCVQYHRDTAAH